MHINYFGSGQNWVRYFHSLTKILFGIHSSQIYHAKRTFDANATYIKAVPEKKYAKTKT